MWEELEYLSKQAAVGRISRRNFSAGPLRSASPQPCELAAFQRRSRCRSEERWHPQGWAGRWRFDQHLDPALSMTQVPFAFRKMWGEMIVELSPEGEPENRIAEEIGSSDDAKVWTLKMRDGIEFHNGKTVDAKDVSATLERHSDEKSKSVRLAT